MKKKILTFGYQLDFVNDLDEISFSNYSLNFSTEKRWQNKIDRIQSMIDQQQIQCVVFVVSKKFIDENYTLEKEKFIELLEICKQTNCIVTIQEYLLQDKPVYIDYVLDRKFTIQELEEFISKKEKEDKKTANIEYSIPIPDFPTFDIEDYKRKLTLLKNTEYFFPLIKERIKILKEFFQDVSTFRYTSEIQNVIKQDLIQHFSNEILNIYIPNQYGYEYEFDDFIKLFEKYLKNVEQLNFSIEIDETSSGKNYRFISNDLIQSTSSLPEKFSRFKNFIELCEKEPDQALKILDNKNIPSKKALEIIQRLSKKYKRLTLDIQQQKERMELAMKQEIQLELLEHDPDQTPFSLVDKTFSARSFDNIYNSNEKELELISILKKYSQEKDIYNIQTDFSIIKDQELKKDERKKSGHKIKKTLFKILNKGLEHGEKIIVESFIAYINSKF